MTSSNTTVLLNKTPEVLYEDYLPSVRIILSIIFEELFYLEYFDLLAVEKDPNYRDKMRGFLDSCLLLLKQITIVSQIDKNLYYGGSITIKSKIDNILTDNLYKDWQSELSRILSEDELELKDNESTLRTWEYHRNNSIKKIANFDDLKAFFNSTNFKLSYLNKIKRQLDRVMKEFARSESEYVRLYKGLFETDEVYDWLYNYLWDYTDNEGKMRISESYNNRIDKRILLPWRTEFYAMMLMIPDRIAKDENDLTNLRRAANTLAFGCGRSLYKNNGYVLPQDTDIVYLLNEDNYHSKRDE